MTCLLDRNTRSIINPLRYICLVKSDQQGFAECTYLVSESVPMAGKPSFLSLSLIEPLNQTQVVWVTSRVFSTALRSAHTS